MKTLTLTTKIPSVNSMYRGRRFLTKDGKEAKQAIQWEIKSQHSGEPTLEPVELNIIFYVKNNRADIDNMLKAAIDCLTGLVYKDDSQIVALHVFKEVGNEVKTVIQIV